MSSIAYQTMYRAAQQRAALAGEAHFAFNGDTYHTVSGNRIGSSAADVAAGLTTAPTGLSCREALLEVLALHDAKETPTQLDWDRWSAALHSGRVS